MVLKCALSKKEVRDIRFQMARVVGLWIKGDLTDKEMFKLNDMVTGGVDEPELYQ